MREFRYRITLPESEVRRLIAPWYGSNHRRTDLFLEEDVFLFDGVCAAYIWLAETEGRLWVYREDGADLPRFIDDFVGREGVVFVDGCSCAGSPEEQFARSPREDEFVAWAERSYEAAKKAVELEMRRYYRRLGK